MGDHSFWLVLKLFHYHGSHLEDLNFWAVVILKSWDIRSSVSASFYKCNNSSIADFFLFGLGELQEN
jgi:hypothetical protein